MIEPKEIEIDGKTFIISKLPATAGREILGKYGLSSIPKIGDYKVNEEMMFKLLCYTAIKIKDSGTLIKLTTRELIDNHCHGEYMTETLIKLEREMFSYNFSFFQKGRVSTFFQDIAQKIPELISKTLILFSQLSSQTEKPPSTN